MKWKLLVLAGLFWGVMNVAYAEDAVINDAPATTSKVVAVINALSPGFDEVYSVRDGEFKEGISSALYNFKSKGYHLASARLGYAHLDELIYGSLALDLPGLSRRLIPSTVRGLATTGYLSVLWNAVGKYGCMGPFGGYSFQEAAVDWGATVGGCVSF